MTAGASVVALWFAVAGVRGILWAPKPLGYGLRLMGAVTGPVDVLAQQLPTFGLIQGLLASRIGRTTAFLLAWSSFAVAHAIFASPQIAIIAVILGGVFGLLLNRTGNLGAGLGLHSTFYLMRSVLGYSA